MGSFLFDTQSFNQICPNSFAAYPLNSAHASSEILMVAQLAFEINFSISVMDGWMDG